MVNANQYSQKPVKREVDPNAPPRPNLFSHEKALKESQVVIEDLNKKIKSQAAQIEDLQGKYNRMQQSINMMLEYMRRG